MTVAPDRLGPFHMFQLIVFSLLFPKGMLLFFLVILFLVKAASLFPDFSGNVMYGTGRPQTPDPDHLLSPRSCHLLSPQSCHLLSPQPDHLPSPQSGHLLSPQPDHLLSPQSGQPDVKSIRLSDLYVLKHML